MEKAARLVVVGYGMGAQHARYITEVPGLVLYGVCDIDPMKRDRAARDFPGIRTFDEFDRVLSDPALDGVVIVTPHSSHAPMAVSALNAGKHVITDKSMCLSVEEARAMIRARDRSGRILTVFQNRRWDRDFLTVRRVVEEGLLGQLYHIESAATFVGMPGGWRCERDLMGGWLFDWGAHTIDQILLLARSRPQTVFAFAHHRREDPRSVEDYVHCSIVFENGMTATTVIGYINPIAMPRWYIVGEKASLKSDDFESPLRLKGRIAGVEAEMTVPLEKGEWRSFYENLARVVAGVDDLAVKAEELVPQIAIAEAAYQSIKTRQAVQVQELLSPGARAPFG